MLHAFIELLAESAFVPSKITSFKISRDVGFYRTEQKNKKKIRRIIQKILFCRY